MRISKKNSSNMREEYIVAPKSNCKEKVMPYLLTREVLGVNTYKIGEMIGTTESVIKKFERGESIDNIELIYQSYAMALSFIYSQKFRNTFYMFTDYKIYSPIILLEELIERLGMIGIKYIKNAISSANQLYKFNWTLELTSTNSISVFDQDCGNYFYITVNIL